MSFYRASAQQFKERIIFIHDEQWIHVHVLSFSYLVVYPDAQLQPWVNWFKQHSKQPRNQVSLCSLWETYCQSCAVSLFIGISVIKEKPFFFLFDFLSSIYNFIKFVSSQTINDNFYILFFGTACVYLFVAWTQKLLFSFALNSFMSGLHLVLLPKDDDPSKAVLAACNEKELIRLAAQKCSTSAMNGLYFCHVFMQFLHQSMLW